MGNPADKITSKKRLPSLPASNHVLPSGESTRYSGIYQLEHLNPVTHKIRKEVFIPQGTRLPVCANCAGPLQYRLIRRVNYIGEDQDFQ